MRAGSTLGAAACAWSTPAAADAPSLACRSTPRPPAALQVAHPLGKSLWQSGGDRNLDLVHCGAAGGVCG